MISTATSALRRSLYAVFAASRSRWRQRGCTDGQPRPVGNRRHGSLRRQ